MFCIFDRDPVFREPASTFPGASVLETLGLSGWLRYLERMPRAEARLLAIEAPKSRGGYLGCFASLGIGWEFLSAGVTPDGANLEEGVLGVAVASAESPFS